MQQGAPMILNIAVIFTTGEQAQAAQRPINHPSGRN
jgi:hypothetical protein